MRRPDEILSFRSLREILAAKPQVLWSVGPRDSAFSALRIMADKNIGLVVVLEAGAMVGVLSERDCARELVLARKPAEATPVADIMVRNVISVEPRHTFGDCLKLMHAHRIRHLPVLVAGKPFTVVSIRDLLGEAVKHHTRIINELERERLTILNSTA